MIIDLLGIAILLALLGIILLFAAYQLPPRRVGYIALPMRAVPAVVEALDLDGKGTLYDLGCGDGRILKAALKRYPKIKAVGIEINPVVARLARIWHWRTKNLQIIRGDIMEADLSKAKWIFTYLKPPQMAKLEPKLQSDLKKGTRVVACDFPLFKKKPHQQIKIGQPWQLGQTLYVYKY